MDVDENSSIAQVEGDAGHEAEALAVTTESIPTSSWGDSSNHPWAPLPSWDESNARKKSLQRMEWQLEPTTSTSMSGIVTDESGSGWEGQRSEPLDIQTQFPEWDLNTLPAVTLFLGQDHPTDLITTQPTLCSFLDPISGGPGPPIFTPLGENFIVTGLHALMVFYTDAQGLGEGPSIFGQDFTYDFPLGEFPTLRAHPYDTVTGEPGDIQLERSNWNLHTTPTLAAASFSGACFSTHNACDAYFLV
jgi:hypothetical protein